MSLIKERRKRLTLCVTSQKGGPERKRSLVLRLKQRQADITHFLPSQEIFASVAMMLLMRFGLFLWAAPSFKSNSFEPSSACSVDQDSVSAIDVDESEWSLRGQEHNFLLDLVRNLLRAFTTKQDVGSSLLEVISFASESLKICAKRLLLIIDH